MVSEIKKEKRLWVEEYFMEEVEHVLGQEAFNEVGGNGGCFRWESSLDQTIRLRTRMVTYGKAQEEKNLCRDYTLVKLKRSIDFE